MMSKVPFDKDSRDSSDSSDSNDSSDRLPPGPRGSGPLRDAVERAFFSDARA